MQLIYDSKTLQYVKLEDSNTIQTKQDTFKGTEEECNNLIMTLGLSEVPQTTRPHKLV